MIDVGHDTIMNDYPHLLLVFSTPQLSNVECAFYHIKEVQLIWTNLSKI